MHTFTKKLVTQQRRQRSQKSDQLLISESYLFPKPHRLELLRLSDPQQCRLLHRRPQLTPYSNFRRRDLLSAIIFVTAHSPFTT